MKVTKTERGFVLVEFKDERGILCTIQESSDAMKNCIWLGSQKINLREFKDGRWEPRPEFDAGDFVASNRMHLTQGQVIELLPFLNQFAQTGNIKEPVKMILQDTADLQTVAVYDEIGSRIETISAKGRDGHAMKCAGLNPRMYKDIFTYANHLLGGRFTDFIVKPIEAN